MLRHYKCDWFDAMRIAALGDGGFPSQFFCFYDGSLDKNQLQASGVCN